MIGAALIIFAPAEITGAIGLEHAGRAAAKIALFAGLVWAVVGTVRIVGK
jgi:hypothetical protein